MGYMVGTMQQADIPHNLLIADSGMRIFIWPQVCNGCGLTGRVHGCSCVAVRVTWTVCICKDCVSPQGL